MANVLFKRGNTATINGTAITDGQLLYDTTTGRHYEDVGSTRIEVGKPVDSALSTTSTNAIANNAITTSIINTTAEVSAITADNIPCGTKPVKELITNLTISYGICTTYSATATYALKSLVIYSNKLYRCITAITVAEAWNAAHWTAIADTNNGTVYNTTDSSFYGIRGADSVTKKLGRGAVTLTRIPACNRPHYATGYPLEVINNGIILDVKDFTSLNITGMGGTAWAIQGITSGGNATTLANGVNAYYTPATYDITNYDTIKIVSYATDGSASNACTMSGILS